MKRLAYGRGCRIAFLSQMYLDDDGKLKKGFGSVVEPYIDLMQQFEKKVNISEYFLDSVHGSARGHNEIAKIVYDYVNVNLLIDKKSF